jgi:hypothetical protein
MPTGKNSTGSRAILHVTRAGSTQNRSTIIDEQLRERS